MLYKVGLVFATQHHESVMTIIYHFNENLGNATRSVWALTGYKGNKLEKMEKTKEKNRNTIERIIQVIIIPFVLAMFAALIKNESDANVIVAYGIYFIFFPIALLITIFGLFEVFNMINKSEFNKLKNFSDDLQGILDTQYVGGLFEKV